MALWIAQALMQGLGTVLELQDNQVAEYQNQINAEENQRLARQAAADSVVRGNQEAARIRAAATQMIARQQVAFGASGVDGTVGTAADVAGGTAALAELDALTAQNNAAREAWGFRRQEDLIRRQAKLDKMKHSSRQAGTALGGTGRVVSTGAAGYSQQLASGAAPNTFSWEG